MFFAYILVSLVMGMFMTFIWSSKGFANTMIKVFFGCYTVWTAALVIGYLVRVSAAAGMRFF